MHVCIVGTGASGWISAHYLKSNKQVSKITIIGSDKIPTIGVGESTTHSFREFLIDRCGLSDKDYTKFLLDSDAAFKYGVCYEGWSDRKFLHPFAIGQHAGYLLGQKDPQDDYHKYVNPVYEEIYKNNIYFGEQYQEYSFHFDANKFIKSMKELAKKSEIINHVVDTVVDSTYNKFNNVTSLTTESGEIIEADFFVSCVGEQAFNQSIFREEYVSYNDVLLTNKAIACPLEYKDDREQFHPYTVAKTMSNGWRWITPTQSRIGTGYVFSNNHISTDQACNELLEDIGDKSLSPFEVDFTPRRVKEIFKGNVCTIGMAAGFLEPLDAPGLALTLKYLGFLEDVLADTSSWNSHEIKMIMNKEAIVDYEFFCSFILHQYKTAKRTDTDFWIDQKNVEFEPYNQILQYVFNPELNGNNQLMFPKFVREPWMFYNSTAGKDIRWNVKIDEPLIDVTRKSYQTHLLYNHRDLINKMVKDVS